MHHSFALSTYVVRINDYISHEYVMDDFGNLIELIDVLLKQSDYSLSINFAATPLHH